jgi:hypothetical protein
VLIGGSVAVAADVWRSRSEVQPEPEPSAA